MRLRGTGLETPRLWSSDVEFLKYCENTPKNVAGQMALSFVFVAERRFKLSTIQVADAPPAPAFEIVL